MKKSLGFCLFLFSAPILFAQPTVTTILPASGSTTGGDFVHVRGDQLHGLVTFCPGVSCTNSVKFGDAFGRIVSNSVSEIVAIAPPHAPGSVDVTVTITGVATPVVVANGYRYQNRGQFDVERILIPIAASGPGPNSARFETEILITNAGDELVGIGGATLEGPGPFFPPPKVLPHTTRTFTDLMRNSPRNAGGVFLYYYFARSARDVIVKVRVHDTSRDSSGFGVEIPAVSDLDFASTVRLPGIPTDPRFRATLRIYAYDATNCGPVTLRVRDNADGALLATVPVALAVDHALPETFPASAQVSLDPIIAPLRDHPRLRIDLADSDAVRPIWAFASITNNQTQEITLVTPQSSGAAATPEKIPLGWWTNAAGQLILTGDTESKAYLDCRIGTFKAPPSLDRDGRFQTTGSLSGPGPVQISEPPLNFEGRIADGWLNLTIRSDSEVITTTQLQFVGPKQPGPLPVACP